MEERIDLRNLELDIRYSSIQHKYILIDGQQYTLKEAFEIALRLQSASTEILNYLERNIRDSL